MKNSRKKTNSSSAGKSTRRKPRAVNARIADRVTTAPVARGEQITSGTMQMSRSRGSDQAIRVAHREYIGDVTGSTSQYDLAKTVIINPGFFPWLANIAVNYESYVFKKLEFHYVSSVSTSTSGYVCMAVDFDAADPAPGSKQQLMSYNHAVRANPWDHAMFSCGSANLIKMANQRYNRFGALVANLDTKTYDLGQLFVAVGGNPTATIIGELYVDYVVEFHTPQLQDLAAEYGVRLTCSSGVTKVTPFGTAAAVAGPNRAGITPDSTGAILNFPNAGTFKFDFDTIGTVFTGNPLIANTAGDGLVNILGTIVDAAATHANTQAEFNVKEAPAEFTFDWSGVAGTLTSLIARANPYPYIL